MYFCLLLVGLSGIVCAILPCFKSTLICVIRFFLSFNPRYASISERFVPDLDNCGVTCGVTCAFSPSLSRFLVHHDYSEFFQLIPCDYAYIMAAKRSFGYTAPDHPCLHRHHVGHHAYPWASGASGVDVERARGRPLFKAASHRPSPAPFWAGSHICRKREKNRPETYPQGKRVEKQGLRTKKKPEALKHKASGFTHRAVDKEARTVEKRWKTGEKPDRTAVSIKSAGRHPACLPACAAMDFPPAPVSQERFHHGSVS